MLLACSLFRRRKDTAKPILDDELWALIEPLLPAPKPRRIRYSGRKPLDNRAVLTGILFVLQTGLRWDLLPREIGCGSGMSCRRRPRDTSRRQAYGTSCTRCCLRGYAQPTKSSSPIGCDNPESLLVEFHDRLLVRWSSNFAQHVGEFLASSAFRPAVNP